MGSIKELERTVHQLKEQLQKRDAEVEKLRQQLENSKREADKLRRRLSDEGVNHFGSNGSSAVYAVSKNRFAISAEPSSDRKALTSSKPSRKTSNIRSFLTNSFLRNDFMKHLDISQIEDIVTFMTYQEHSNGSRIIEEGEVGNYAYVIEEGEVEVTKEGIFRRSMQKGKVFGELAILYGCLRTASVTAVTRCKLWVIDRGTFQNVLMESAKERHSRHLEFLRSVEKFKHLGDDVKEKLADILEEIHYIEGEYVIRQGAPGDTFYIIQEGTVTVTQNDRGSEIKIKQMYRKECFGELALEREEVRSANVIASGKDGVKCLCLDRDAYLKLVSTKFNQIPIDSHAFTVIPPELKNIRLRDITVTRTLGEGGFGRVELCHVTGHEQKAYALKSIKKVYIVQNRQQRHVLDEKKIMMTVHHPFIVKLYMTFKDRKYVYMLMESCMGGELYYWLRKRKRFVDNIAQFYVACVVEALQHLHRKGIVYRDLKPENLLLDHRGYIKMVDFGFAKDIGQGKRTYTFCGTPEYVAPEIILNRGYTLSVDFWSLGVLVYELLNGKPPFTGSDAMEIYKNVQKGIQAAGFPKTISKKAENLIRKLCRHVPSDRLGYSGGGYADIEKHKWFEAFDWNALRAQNLPPPIQPEVRRHDDARHFPNLKDDLEEVEDEVSGWDRDF